GCRSKLDNGAPRDEISRRHPINLSSFHLLEETAHKKRLGLHGTILQRRSLDRKSACRVHFTWWTFVLRIFPAPFAVMPVIKVKKRSRRYAFAPFLAIRA